MNERRQASDLLERARDIELLVTDVDGVLTDGSLYYGPNGEVMKRFDVKDGHGIALAGHVGLRTAILTARQSEIVATRARELRIEPVIQGARDKAAGLAELVRLAGVSLDRIAYVGDDLNDLPPLGAARLAACPSDARHEVRAACHYVAEARGGHGVIREILELILTAQGRWAPVLASFTQG